MAHCEMYPKHNEPVVLESKVGFPVVFTKTGEYGYVIHVPDLRIYTKGKDFEDGITMAGGAIGLVCVDLQDDKKEIPKSTNLEDVNLELGEFATMVYVNLDVYKAQLQNSRKMYDDEDMMSPEGCNDLGEKATTSSEYTIKTPKYDTFGSPVTTDETVNLPDPKTLTRIGLKGFWKERKNNGQAFRYKLRDYFYEIKEAFRRAWNGYDACDVYDLGPILCQKLRVQLVSFYEEHSEQIDEPDIDKVVLEIMDLLKYEDIDYAFAELFPGVPETEMEVKGFKFTTRDYTPEQIKEASIYRELKLGRAFTLFGRYVLRLWI